MAAVAVAQPLEICSASLSALADKLSAVAQPQYERAQVSPGIVHIGVGNFHRAHQCVFADDALSLPGHSAWGVAGIGLMPGDARLRDALRAQDGLFTVWQRGGDVGPRGSARVIGCHTEFVLAPEDPEATLRLLSAPSTKIVTLTITEKGYGIDLATGRLNAALPGVARDIAALQDWGTAEAAAGAVAALPQLQTAAGYVVAAAKRRRAVGGEGFALLSCDNMQENGNKARVAVLGTADAVDPALAAWMRTHVTFPNSMVDRITPATTQEVISELAAEYHVADKWPVVCESFLLWVVEDNFPYGRPSWERCASGRCLLVRDVVPYELMKLRLLNSVHQALSYPGCLLGHEFVHEAMLDARVSGFLERYMAAAGRTVPPVEGIEQVDWQATVVQRFSNPAICDTIFRLTEDATNRMAVALAPCLHEDALAEASFEGGSLSTAELQAVVLPVACWVRCLVGDGGDNARRLPQAARLNRDAHGDEVRPLAEQAWRSAAADGEEEKEQAAAAAAAFLRGAFDSRAARAEVCDVLVAQLRLLQGDDGVEAALAAVCSSS